MDSDGRAVHLKEGGDGQGGSYLFVPLSRRGTEAAGAGKLPGQLPQAAGQAADKVCAFPHTSEYTHPEQGRGIGGKGRGGEGGGCADAGASVVTQAA